jgi:dTDP-4-dehydrorhamnose 3,5-epimerase
MGAAVAHPGAETTASSIQGLFMLPGAKKDQPTVTSEGELRRDLIADVRVKEMRNLVTRNGVTTEIYRTDWGIGPVAVAQIIRVSLRGKAVSAWHCHRQQTDHIFVTDGAIKLVLFDDREGSPTRGMVNEFHLGIVRPMLVVVPPRVWHGIENLMPDSSAFVNFFDRTYRYDDPDEWRLPPDSSAIPYRF